MGYSSDSILILGDAEDYLKNAFSETYYSMTVADDGEAWCSGRPGPRVNEQINLEMALRSVLRMDPDEILVSSATRPPDEIVPAIILTGHRLLYWWKDGEKDRALLRWQDWKFEKVVEVLDGKVRVLADKELAQPDAPIQPPPVVPDVPFSPEEFKALKDAVFALARPAFRPETGVDKRDSFIQEGSLMLQLAQGELPVSALVFPEGKSYLQLHWDQSTGKGTVQFVEAPETGGDKALYLTDWMEFQSVPHYDDDRLELDEGLDEVWPDLQVASLLPWAGDHLGGWPFWVQGFKVEKCPDCGTRMLCRFQLSSESEGLVPGLFAAEGTGQILQCAQHPEQLKWIWAC